MPNKRILEVSLETLANDCSLPRLTISTVNLVIVLLKHDFHVVFITASIFSICVCWKKGWNGYMHVRKRNRKLSLIAQADCYRFQAIDESTIRAE